MSDDQPDKPETPLKDPLDDPSRHRGPLLWAVLLFVPIILTLVVSLLKDDSTGEHDTVNAPVAEEVVPAEQGTNTGVRHRLSRSSSCGSYDWQGKRMGEEAVEFLKKSGRLYRILPPGAHMTSDYDTDRVNFDLDERGVITRVWCG